MLSFEQLQKIWNNLPEAVKLDILAYASALVQENDKLPIDNPELVEREENCKNSTTTSWNYIFNSLNNELI
jgi:hypothetical protein